MAFLYWVGDHPIISLLLTTITLDFIVKVTRDYLEYLRDTQNLFANPKDDTDDD